MFGRVNKYQSSVFLDLVMKQKPVIGFPGFSYDSQQLFAILLIVINAISTNVKLQQNQPINYKENKLNYKIYYQQLLHPSSHSIATVIIVRLLKSSLSKDFVCN